MDGKNRAEIKKYILVFFALTICIIAGSYTLARHGENTKRNQIAELVREYPEMEADVIRIMEKGALCGDYSGQEDMAEQTQETEKILDRLEEIYGYHYTKGISDHWEWRFCVFCIVVSGVLLGILWIVSGRKKVIREAVTEEQQMKLEESLKEAGTYIENLKEKYGKEEEKTKALITNISHQLKTPLASLRMSHELTVSDYLTEEERKEFLAQEGIEIEKLQTLLDELIKLSRLEKNMIKLEPESSSLRDTISEAVSVIYPKALMKSVNIQVEMEEDIVVRHDVRWTSEVFVNILDNAVKYSPEHTEITICVRILGQNVLIEFMDEGPGISDEEKHKIYQRFYRGRNSEGADGAGVGLYLARQILEEQGGSIMVKNRYPKGSIFRVLLPL